MEQIVTVHLQQLIKAISTACPITYMSNVLTCSTDYLCTHTEGKIVVCGYHDPLNVLLCMHTHANMCIHTHTDSTACIYTLVTCTHIHTQPPHNYGESCLQIHSYNSYVHDTKHTQNIHTCVHITFNLNIGPTQVHVYVRSTNWGKLSLSIIHLGHQHLS